MKPNIKLSYNKHIRQRFNKMVQEHPRESPTSKHRETVRE